MWEFGRDSWRISVRRREDLLDGALWVRDAERIDVPVDRLVPGPLDLDPDVLPPPPKTTDQRLGPQWLGWWRSLIDPTGAAGPIAGAPESSPRQSAPSHRQAESSHRRSGRAEVAGPEPAFGTPDPLGLARHPQLAEVVARRWDEATAWRLDRPSPTDSREPPMSTDGAVVRQVEQAAGRPVQPFRVEFVLLPVRDVLIRRVRDHHYLVPERVYDGRGWRGWLRGLITDIGYPASDDRRV